MEGGRGVVLFVVLFCLGADLLGGGIRLAAAQTSDLPDCGGPLVSTLGETTTSLSYNLAAQSFYVIDESDLISFNLLLSASGCYIAATAEVQTDSGGEPSGTALINSSFAVLGPGANTSSPDSFYYLFNSTTDSAVRLAPTETYWLVLTTPDGVLLDVSSSDQSSPDPNWPINLYELMVSYDSGSVWNPDGSGRTAIVTLQGCHAIRPSPSPSSSPSSSPAPSSSPSPSLPPSPSQTPSPSSSPSGTPSPTSSPSETPSSSPSPTGTPSPSPSPSATSSPSPSPTPSPTPTPTPSPSPSPSPVICGQLVGNSNEVTASLEFPVAAQQIQVVDTSAIQSFTVNLAAQNDTNLESAQFYTDSRGQPGAPVDGSTFDVASQTIVADIVGNASLSAPYTFSATSAQGVRLTPAAYWLVLTASQPQTLALDVTEPYSAQPNDPLVLGSLLVDDGSGNGYVDTGMAALASFDGCHAIRPSPSPSCTPSLSPSASATPSVSPSPSPSPSPVICATLGNTNADSSTAWELGFDVVAQKVRVFDTSDVQSFTVQISAQSDSSLAEAEFYDDNAGLPGSPVANATFEVSSVSIVHLTQDNATLSAVYSFNSTNPKGARLQGSGTSYWLVLTASDVDTLALDVVNGAQPANPLDSIGVRVNQVALYSNASGWVLSTYNVTALLRLDGCHAIRPSPSASVTPSNTPSNTPTSTPTPSRAPAVTPIVANVTTNFNDSAPVVNMSAPITTPTPSPAASTQPPSDGGSSPSPSASPQPVTQVSVTSSFTDLQIGNTTLPADSLGGYTFSVLNTTSSTPTANSTTGNDNSSSSATTGSSLTYVYTAQLDNMTTFEQAYTFHSQARESTFANLTFPIGASSLKWSINLTTSAGGVLSAWTYASPSPSPSLPISSDDDPSSSSGNATTDSGGVPLRLRYNLKGMLTSGAAFNTSSGESGVIRRNNEPRANMTTYYLPLASSGSGLRTVAAKVEVFDVALLDGRLVMIAHDIALLNSSSTSTNDSSTSTVDQNAIEYVLELFFPPFDTSLYYDPSLGLAVLVGTSPDHSGGDGGGISDTGLIVALAVVLPLAALVVVVVVVAGFLVLRYKKQLRERRTRMPDGAVNFNPHDDL